MSKTSTTAWLAVSVALLVGSVFLPEVQATQSTQETQDEPGKFALKPEQHAARGFGADSARVDSQITFKIPAGQADAVYEYLKGKYVGQEDILPEQFPGRHLRGQKMSDLSVFTDEYFDTPTLQLRANKNSARHRSRLNTTNPDDRKSGRELVQMKVTPPGAFTLRNELKYEVEEEAKQGEGGENHPLIRLISRKLRDDFRKVYTDAGIDPYSLRHIFTIVQTRRRGYLNWDDKNIFSFSVDEGSARILWAKGSFSSVDLGLVEIAYTEGSEEQRQRMWAVRDAIIQDLQAHFPALAQNSDSKYSLVLAQLEAQLPLLPLILRSGLTPAQALTFVVLIVALLIFALVHVVRKRKRARALEAQRS